MNYLITPVAPALLTPTHCHKINSTTHHLHTPYLFTILALMILAFRQEKKSESEKKIIDLLLRGFWSGFPSCCCCWGIWKALSIPYRPYFPFLSFFFKPRCVFHHSLERKYENNVNIITALPLISKACIWL